MDFNNLLEQLDFADFVSTKVKLSKSGVNRFRGLSPFTSEKTPSFYIDNQAKTWYCFSSGQGGGVIDYIMKTENLDKMESMSFLKDYLGIYEEEETEESKIKKALNIAHKFFLKEQRLAVSYLEERGISKENAENIASKYELGVLNNKNLYKYLLSAGVEESIIKKTGIFYEDNNSRYLNRMTIPIRNEYGSIISFTGRDLTGSAKSKYMHGITTNLFKKKNVVWNLSKVRNMITEQDRVIVCEGQMDAIAVAELGLPAVAILGSKVSEQQLLTISKLTNNIYMIFDSDRAGEDGLISAFKMLSSMDLDSVFYSVIIPGDKDPDDYIKNNGVDHFIKLIEDAKPDTSHIVQILVKKNLEKGAASKPVIIRKILSELQPYMKKSYTYRALDMLERISQELGLSRKELQSWANSGSKFGYSQKTLNKIKEIQFPAPVYERRILYAVLKDSNLLFKFKDAGLSEYDFESQFVGKIISFIEPGLSANEILGILETNLKNDEYDLVVAFLSQGLLETDFETSLDILKAKVKFRVEKAATDFLGRPVTATEVEFKRVVGDVVKYGKEPF